MAPRDVTRDHLAGATRAALGSRRQLDGVEQLAGGTRLLGWARTGVPSYEYESLTARAAAIEAGADRPAAILIQDVRQTADAFAAAATGMPPEAWQRFVRYTAGQEPRRT
jgi:hypothetical protein